MALEEYRYDVEGCCKCSICRFVPMEKIGGKEHSYVCPSVSRFNFNAYSAGGRLSTATAILNKQMDYDDKVQKIAYDCQLCGACDVSCKYANDMDVSDPLNEMRIQCVESGRTVPALDKTMVSLEKQGTMAPGARKSRGKWAEGLQVPDYAKTQTDVVFHAGCRICFDQSLWKSAQAAVRLMQKAGVNVGIGGENEPCCTGRAYHMGYKDAFLKHSAIVGKLFKKCGVKIVVTGCAECYHAFNVLYDRFDVKGGLQVVHISQYLGQLIDEGRLQPKQKVPMTVTYHDPCHLGRRGEPYIHWKGKQVPGEIRIFDPPREFMRGTYGVYEPPRELLKAIPGLKVMEMDRIKEYAWCCGAGGGVRESNPDFADWTADERVEEARTTGAEAIITGCPGCQHGLAAAAGKNGGAMRVYDIAEVVARAIL